MSQNNELREALQALHDDIAEYQRINHLGGYDNHCMKRARAAIAAHDKQSLDTKSDLHQYQEIAEHYAKCEISPESLRDWVAERMGQPAQAGQSEPRAAQKALATWGCTGSNHDFSTILQRGDDLASALRKQLCSAPVRQPLTGRQVYDVIAATVDNPESFDEVVNDGPEWGQIMEWTRGLEAAHGISAQGGTQ